MIEAIVSHGQTRVDRAAIDAAPEPGISSRRWCPKYLYICKVGIKTLRRRGPSRNWYTQPILGTNLKNICLIE